MYFIYLFITESYTRYKNKHQYRDTDVQNEESSKEEKLNENISKSDSTDTLNKTRNVVGIKQIGSEASIVSKQQETTETSADNARMYT